MSANEDRLQTACIYAKFVRVITFHKFNSTANSADMQENNDPSCLLLSEVYLLVQKFANLSFSLRVEFRYQKLFR